MNDNITVHFHPPDTKDGKTMHGTAGNNSLNAFADRFVTELTSEFVDFQIPTRIVVSERSNYSQSLENASSRPSRIHLRFRISQKSREMQWPSRPVVTTSAFDQTVLASYITRHLEHWQVNPWLQTSETTSELEALKHGCIPVTITLGAYHDLTDLAQIERTYPNISRATTRALVNYLWPFYYGSTTTPLSVQERIEETFRQESQGEALA